MSRRQVATRKLARAVPSVVDMEHTLESAWAELLDVAPPGWALGKPTYDPGLRAWQLYAFDQTERAKAGKRIRA